MCHYTRPWLTIATDTSLSHSSLGLLFAAEQGCNMYARHIGYLGLGTEPHPTSPSQVLWVRNAAQLGGRGTLLAWAVVIKGPACEKTSYKGPCTSVWMVGLRSSKPPRLLQGPLQIPRGPKRREQAGGHILAAHCLTHPQHGTLLLLDYFVRNESLRPNTLQVHRMKLPF